MSINPVNKTTAKEFAELWQYSDFYKKYYNLTKNINAVYPQSPKKLVRFFDDLNRDLKLFTHLGINVRFIMRIQDYEYRIRDMKLGFIKICIGEFLNYTKDFIVKSRYKELDFREQQLKLGNDPYYYCRRNLE